MNTFANLTSDMLSNIMIGVESLTSYTGKSNHVASVLFSWRPFLDALWAAVAKSNSALRQGRASRHCIWVKHIKASVSWLALSMQLSPGALSHEWSMAHFTADASDLTITLDASPWGLGGILSQHGAITHYFSTPIGPDDEAIHQQEIGKSDGQQVWECLCVLVAMRAWVDVWAPRRSTVTVRSDNMSALALASKLKSAAGSNLIGRELALLYTEACWEPRVVEHLPGVANGLSDSLSRLAEPGRSYTVPPAQSHL